MKLVLFGFIRDILQQSKMLHAPLRSCEKYVFSPTVMYEHHTNETDGSYHVTKDMVASKFNNIKKIELYDYKQARQKHIQTIRHLREQADIPEVLYHLAPPFRILSLFYNVKSALNLVPRGPDWRDEIIILARIDSDIYHLNKSRINELLEQHDIICTNGYREPKKAVVDNVFIMKGSGVDTFTSLYDDYGKYLVQGFKGTPERTYWHHFITKQSNVFVDQNKRTPCLLYNFRHCNSWRVKQDQIIKSIRDSWEKK